MDPVPSTSPEQPIVSPEVPVIKPKSRILIWVVGGIVVLGIGIIIGLLLNKKSSSAPKIPPTPSPVSQATPTPDPTVSWKVFSSLEFSLSFRHPNLDDSCCSLAGAVVGNPVHVVTLADKATIIPAGDGPFDGIAIYVVSNKEGLTLDQYLEKEKLALINQFKTVAGSNQTHAGRVFETSISGQRAVVLIDYSWDGIDRTYFVHPDKKYPQNIIEISKKEKSLDHFATYNQILSTFKFLESSPKITLKPTKTLKYFLPSGWKTLQDKTGSFEIGYDPSTMKGDGAVSQSITLLRLRPDPSMGYSSHFNVRLLSYSGGSRHQFIYSSMQVVPTKQDYLPGYKEVEYLYNGKSCLFLEGIGVSQIPTTWGMCDVGNNQAFLITTWTSGQELETMIQTIRLLRLGLIGGAEG